MDKIKPYLLIAQKHHFWILAVVLLVLSAYAWYAGTAAYFAEFQKNKSAIEAAFSQANLVSSQPNPPNESFAAALTEFQQKQVQSTMSAWQTLYGQQKDQLIWSVANDRLANLKPDQEIPDDIRGIYMNYFSKEFPKLFEIVKPLHTVEEDKPASTNATARGQSPAMRVAGVNRGSGAKKAQVVGIVDWPSASRDAIRNQYDWQRPPTSTQVRLAQEDYWVYKALLQIIAETNKSIGATNQANAAIKKIEQLAIAQAAATPSHSEIEYLTGGEAAQGQGGSSGPSSSTKVPTANSSDEEWLAGRYASTDAAASGDAGGGGGGAAGGEYKLIPVVLRFRMDERRIPNLLVACANSPLTVDVEPVLYNPGTKASTSSSQSGPAGPPSAPGKKEARPDSDYYEATVEVRGVVYLFNAPNKTALGLPEEQAADPGMNPPTTPTEAAPVTAAPPGTAPTGAAPAGAAPTTPAPVAGAPAPQPAAGEPAAPAAEGQPPAAPMSPMAPGAAPAGTPPAGTAAGDAAPAGAVPASPAPVPTTTPPAGEAPPGTAQPTESTPQ